MKITTTGAGSVTCGPTIDTGSPFNPAPDGVEPDVSTDALDRVRRLDRYLGERGCRQTGAHVCAGSGRYRPGLAGRLTGS